MSHLVRSIGGGLGRGFWTLFSASFLANLSDGIFWIASGAPTAAPASP